MLVWNIRTQCIRCIRTVYHSCDKKRDGVSVYLSPLAQHTYHDLMLGHPKALRDYFICRRHWFGYLGMGCMRGDGAVNIRTYVFYQFAERCDLKGSRARVIWRKTLPSTPHCRLVARLSRQFGRLLSLI